MMKLSKWMQNLILLLLLLLLLLNSMRLADGNLDNFGHFLPKLKLNQQQFEMGVLCGATMPVHLEKSLNIESY